MTTYAPEKVYPAEMLYALAYEHNADYSPYGYEHIRLCENRQASRVSGSSLKYPVDFCFVVFFDEQNGKYWQFAYYQGIVCSKDDLNGGDPVFRFDLPPDKQPTEIECWEVIPEQVEITEYRMAGIGDATNDAIK